MCPQGACSIMIAQSTQNQEMPRLLVTAREAAKMLSICEKTLWTLTKNGQIPSVRIGAAVRYDPRDLTRWIDSAKKSKMGD